MTDQEDRGPRSADDEVANLEGAALSFVGRAGTRDDVATAGIERRHVHDGCLDRELLSR